VPGDRRVDPGGKDSLSMQARWQADGVQQQNIAPVSLIVSAFARVADARAHLTPVLASSSIPNCG
jgi:phosphoribosylformylglycinamidine synthase